MTELTLTLAAGIVALNSVLSLIQGVSFIKEVNKDWEARAYELREQRDGTV